MEPKLPVARNYHRRVGCSRFARGHWNCRGSQYSLGRRRPLLASVNGFTSDDICTDRSRRHRGVSCCGGRSFVEGKMGATTGYRGVGDLLADDSDWNRCGNLWTLGAVVPTQDNSSRWECIAACSGERSIALASLSHIVRLQSLRHGSNTRTSLRAEIQSVRIQSRSSNQNTADSLNDSWSARIRIRVATSVRLTMKTSKPISYSEPARSR